MAKITLAPITSVYQSTVQVNANNDAIEEEINSNILYRDNPVGEANQMENLLDMNSNAIINLPNGICSGEPITVDQFINGIANASEGLGTISPASGALILDSCLGNVSVWHIVLGGDVTDISVINLPTGPVALGITLIFESDGSSSVVYGSQFNFIDDVLPTLTTDSGKRDYVVAVTINNGTSFDSVITIEAIGP